MSGPESASVKRPGGGHMRAVLVVFLPFAGGFFLSDLYRQINAVIAPRLIADVELSAAGLGLLTSVFFLAFAAHQLPLGVLLDRFGPRRVQAAQLLIAALGALVFALGRSEATLLVGRALIGLGVSGGLMSALKAFTQWFPRERWPLVYGCFLGIGGIGAMTATAPVEALLQVTDWRGIFLGLAALTLASAAAIFAIVPEASRAASPLSLRRELADLRRIYTDRVFWRIAPVAVACIAGAMSIQGLWAGPWLADVAGLERAGVALYLLVNAGSMALGYAAGGVVADLFGRAGVGLPRVMAVGMGLFMAAQAAIVLELDVSGLWPWILFGLLSNVAVLSYAHLSRHFPIEFAARATTSLNLVVFVGVFLVQYAIGLVIGAFPPAPGGGFSEAGYQAAFGASLALEIATFAWFLLPARPGRGAGSPRR